MLVRAASVCMVVACVLSKMHHFQAYWHVHSQKWEAAHLLLESEVCTRPHLRMGLRDFDNCAAAESFVCIRPFSRAVYSLAEDMHVCGNERCAILYMDITDRLPYIFALLLMLVIMLACKFARDCRYNTLLEQSNALQLPQHRKLD